MASKLVPNIDNVSRFCRHVLLPGVTVKTARFVVCITANCDVSPRHLVLKCDWHTDTQA